MARIARFLVRSAIAEQGAPSLAYARALAALMYLLQGSGHYGHAVVVSQLSNGFLVGTHDARGWQWSLHARFRVPAAEQPRKAA